MAIRHAQPGEVVELSPAGGSAADRHTATLLKTQHLELIRLVLPAGKHLAPHRAHNELTLQVLAGRVAVTAHGRTQELAAGQLLLISASEQHALEALADSVVLLSIALPGSKPEKPDLVQEASEESFPASDPPSYTGVVRP